MFERNGKIEPLKFHTEVDKLLFCNEMGLDFATAITESETRLFIKKRKPVIKLMKRFRSSQNSKQSWDKHRTKYLFALRRYAHSIDGRKFHRQLGRWLSKDKADSVSAQEAVREKKEITEWIERELRFYQSTIHQADLEYLLDLIRDHAQDDSPSK